MFKQLIQVIMCDWLDIVKGAIKIHSLLVMPVWSHPSISLTVTLWAMWFYTIAIFITRLEFKFSALMKFVWIEESVHIFLPFIRNLDVNCWFFLNHIVPSFPHDILTRSSSSILVNGLLKLGAGAYCVTHLIYKLVGQFI